MYNFQKDKPSSSFTTDSEVSEVRHIIETKQLCMTYS